MKKRPPSPTLLALTIVLLATASSIAPGQTQDNLKKTTYSAPQLFKDGDFFDSRRFYPADALKNKEEGWVTITAMIRPDGKADEPTITNSGGSPSFRSAALAFTNQHVFIPARINNQSVERAFAFKLEFRNTYQSVAAGRFINGYKNVVKAVEHNDRIAAEAALTAMKPLTLYEDAYLGVTQYLYFQKWGSEKEQLNALRHAIADEIWEKYLPMSLFRALQLALFDLEYQTLRFGDAKETFRWLTQEQRRTPGVAQKITAILAMQRGDYTFTLKEAIDPDETTWRYKLLKHHFSLQAATGELQEIKLRCDTAFVLIPYKPELDYTIPADYGSCDMELIGKGGAEFVLVQS